MGAPHVGAPHVGAPHMGAPQVGGPYSLGPPGGPPSNPGRVAHNRNPFSMQHRAAEEALFGGPPGGPGGPPALGFCRRRSSSDTPLSRASPLKGLQARRLSLRDTQAQSYAQGAPAGAPWGPPSGAPLGAPHTPERLLHPHPSRELNCSFPMQEQQQQHQQQQHNIMHRIEARGATVRRPLGAPAAAATSWGPSSSLPRAPSAFMGPPVINVDSVGGGFEASTAAATAAGAGDGGPSMGPLLSSSRERGRQEGPPFPAQYRETERHALRAPAHLVGALRAPPDTPAAAAVLHLEGPPQPLGAPQEPPVGKAAGGPPAAFATPGSFRSSPSILPSGGPFDGGPLGGPQGGGPLGASLRFSRAPLPAFDSLAALLAPPASEEVKVVGGGAAAAAKGGGAPKGHGGPQTVSGVYIEAAFPSGAPVSKGSGGPPQQQQQQQQPQQVLAAVSSAAAKATLKAVAAGKGPPVLRLPWKGEGGPPQEETGAPEGVGGPPSPLIELPAAAAAAAAAAEQQTALRSPVSSSSVEGLKMSTLFMFCLLSPFAYLLFVSLCLIFISSTVSSLSPHSACLLLFFSLLFHLLFGVSHFCCLLYAVSCLFCFLFAAAAAAAAAAVCLFDFRCL